MDSRRTWSLHLVACLLHVWLINVCWGTEAECPLVDGYSDYGPVTADTLVESYFSVEFQLEGKASLCRLRYHVPVNATLYQGMIAAHQQHGENFTFEYNTHHLYGHHIVAINGVEGHDTFHWALHHGDTWETSEVGVDHLLIADEDLYLWRYTEYQGGEFNPSNFTGDCHAAVDDIQPAFNLTDVVVYISVSAQDTDQFIDGFEPVCKLPLLTPVPYGFESLISLANDQLVLVFEAEINQDTHELASLNELENQGGFEWRIFDARTGYIMPSDLRQSFFVTDGDHFEFRFTPLESGGDTTASPLTTSSAHSVSLVTSQIVLIIVAGLLTVAKQLAC
ncbi:uncharacterized protein [Diadema antillarum]|uniref:uncharacterized protein n=1 Tax=Diadema antillarum TaxID=105358 RepID=UPI003A85577B